MVCLPRLGAAAHAGQRLLRPGAELPGLLLEAGPVDGVHLPAGPARQRDALVVPIAEGDHSVLADLLLAVQVADVPVVDPCRAASDAALQAGG